MKRLALVLALFAAGLLVWGTQCRGRDVGPDLPGGDDVDACVANLQRIYQGLTAYQLEHGRLPEGGGVPFLAALIVDGTWPDDEAHARRLTCPGETRGDRPTDNVPPDEWFDDPGAIGPHSSAYAVRDFERFPLETFPTGGRDPEPLVACDNARGSNHPGGVTCVLFADGSVVTFELAHEIELGTIPAGTERFVVGTDAALDVLQKMVGD